MTSGIYVPNLRLTQSPSLSGSGSRALNGTAGIDGKLSLCFDCFIFDEIKDGVLSLIRAGVGKHLTVTVAQSHCCVAATRPIAPPASNEQCIK